MTTPFAPRADWSVVRNLFERLQPPPAAQPAEALASMKQAAEHAGRAAALEPADMRWRSAECATLTQVADHAYPVVRIHGLCALDEALAAADRAVRCGERLAEDLPADPRAWRLRAYVMRLRAGFTGIQGRLADAEQQERAAFAVLERAIAMPGGEPIRDTDFVPASLRLGITLRTVGRYDEAAVVIERALALSDRRLREDPGNEQVQRHLAASVQTAIDLCLHRRQEHHAEALYERARQALPPLPADEPLGKRHWQQAWMDSLQAVCWVRTGEVERAGTVLDRAQGWVTDGPLRLREHPGALDAELEANLLIARAHVEAAQGRWAAAASAAQEAAERLDAMRALRDPRDAIEALRSWQLRVRLAQVPWGPGEAAAAAGAAVVARARTEQAELLACGWIAPAAHAESAWLAAQPAA